MLIAIATAEKSKDPKRQVGAVIAKDNVHISAGFNGLPRGIADTPKRLHGVTKNKLMLHAEHNALLFSRTDLTGATLYTTKFPCLQCTLSIIQTRIARVVCFDIPITPNWQADYDTSVELLTEAGITITKMEYPDELNQ